jgi:hypothetical protein
MLRIWDKVRFCVQGAVTEAAFRKVLYTYILPILISRME